MNTFKNISDQQLIQNLKSLVEQERRVLVEVLHHLREVERRRLYAAHGYSSLFAYCVEELGYSEAAAGRRIAAMRLAKELPAVEGQISSGQVSLSNAAKLQSFFERERKERAITYSAKEKSDLLLEVAGASARECEKKLSSISPSSALPRERERVITPDLTEIRFLANEKLLGKLSRLKALLSHRQSDPSYAELFEMAADIALAKLERWKTSGATAGDKKTTPTSEQKTKEPVPEPREGRKRGDIPGSGKRMGRGRAHIPVNTVRMLHQRDGRTCAYISSETGKRCGGTHQLQIDHVRPVVLGGTSDLDNLRLLCATHNRWMAVQILGKERMRRHVPGWI